jgi:hypothetical protein
MILSRRERRQLKEIDSAMSAADPRLAAMLAIFTRLAAGEPVPTHVLSHHHGAVHRAWAVIALAFALIAGLITFGAVSSGPTPGDIVPFAVTCVTGHCRGGTGASPARTQFPQR